MFSGPDEYLEYSHWTHKKFFKSIRKKSFPSKSAKTKNCHRGLDTDSLTFFMEFFYVLAFIFRSTRHTFIIFYWKRPLLTGDLSEALKVGREPSKNFLSWFKMKFSSKNWSKLKNELLNSKLESSILGEFFYVLAFLFRSTRHTFIIFLLEETSTYGSPFWTIEKG